ncbi:MAG: hypothetical protein KDB23_03625, partial [Planctomycetales bacterium]|nr:hypothetical protein [Planctomycetales bacterium]
ALLKQRDMAMLENQIKLYVRTRYYEGTDGKFLTNEILRLLSANYGFTGRLEYRDYDYSFWDGWEIDWGDSMAITRDWDLKGGINEISKFFQNPNGMMSSYGIGGVSDTSYASRYLRNIESLLKDRSLYDILNATYRAGNRTYTLGGGQLDSDEHMWFDIKATGVNTSSKASHGFALAKIFDEAMKNYLGVNRIYRDALKARGLTDSDLDTLYTQYSADPNIRGFSWDEANPNKTQMIASVNSFTIEVPTAFLSKLTPSVQTKVTQLEGAFKTSYTAAIDTLKTLAATTDYSDASLTAVKNGIATLKATLDPKTNQTADTGITAEAMFVKAPVYNQLATRLGNGIGDLIGSTATLSKNIADATFSTVTTAASATTFAAIDTVFTGADYTGVRTAYAQAVKLIDDFTTFNNRYELGATPTVGLSQSIVDIQRLDRAATRFAAFHDALTISGGFDFDAFVQDFKDTQAAITSFVVDHPEYDSNLAIESRADAQAGSLQQDGADIAEPVAVNRIQYDLFKSSLDAAKAELETLRVALRAQYTVTFNYWWFSQTFYLPYDQDARYVQQLQLIDQLQDRVNKSDAYADASDAQLAAQQGKQSVYEGKSDAAAANVADFRQQYDDLKTDINAQFLVLKELSKFTIDVLRVTRAGQSANGFVDSNSLLSELIRHVDVFDVLDDGTIPSNTNSSEFVFNSSAVPAGTFVDTNGTDPATITLVAGAGNLQKNAIWSLRSSASGPDLVTHTVVNATTESLASIATSLATKLSALSGYTATASGAVITVTESAADVNAYVQKATSASSVILKSDSATYDRVTAIHGITAKDFYVSHSDIENVTINTGDQADQFAVRDTVGTVAGRFIINTAGGDDQFNVGRADDTVHGILARLQVNGGLGTNTMVVTDSGTNASAFDDGVLTSTKLSGLGMGDGIVYDNLASLTINLGAEDDVFKIASTHTNTTTVNLGAGTNTVSVESTSGPTTVNGGDDGTTFKVGSNTNSFIDEIGVLSTIAAKLTLNGGTGPDTLKPDDQGNSAGSVGDISATLITGFGMGSEGIIINSMDDLQVTLGVGNDLLRVASTYGTATIKTGTGMDTVYLTSMAGDTTIQTEQGNDFIRIGEGANGTVGLNGTLTLDGGNGEDNYLVNFTDDGTADIQVTDSGTDNAVDRLTIYGTDNDDTFWFYTEDDPDSSDPNVRLGHIDFFAEGSGLYTEFAPLIVDQLLGDDSQDAIDSLTTTKVHPVSTDDVTHSQHIMYSTISVVTVRGNQGDDMFIMDGTSQAIDLFGDAGNDAFIIGRVQELTYTNGRIAPTDLTDGVNFNTTFHGGIGEDYFEVNHNVGPIFIYGDYGDDVIFMKSYMLEGGGNTAEGAPDISVSGGTESGQKAEGETDALIDLGGYVSNNEASIDGGAGFDTLILAGTDDADKYYIFVEKDANGKDIQRVYGAGLNIKQIASVESFLLLSGGGDDEVYIYGTLPGQQVMLNLGSGNDTVYFGGDAQTFNITLPGAGLTEIYSGQGYAATTHIETGQAGQRFMQIPDEPYRYDAWRYMMDRFLGYIASDYYTQIDPLFYEFGALWQETYNVGDDFYNTYIGITNYGSVQTLMDNYIDDLLSRGTAWNPYGSWVYDPYRADQFRAANADLSQFINELQYNFYYPEYSDGNSYSVVETVEKKNVNLAFKAFVPTLEEMPFTMPANHDLSKIQGQVRVFGASGNDDIILDHAGADVKVHAGTLRTLDTESSDFTFTADALMSLIPTANGASSIDPQLVAEPIANAIKLRGQQQTGLLESLELFNTDPGNPAAIPNITVDVAAGQQIQSFDPSQSMASLTPETQAQILNSGLQQWLTAFGYEKITTYESYKHHVSPYGYGMNSAWTYADQEKTQLEKVEVYYDFDPNYPVLNMSAADYPWLADYHNYYAYWFGWSTIDGSQFTEANALTFVEHWFWLDSNQTTDTGSSSDSLGWAANEGFFKVYQRVLTDKPEDYTTKFNYADEGAFENGLLDDISLIDGGDTPTQFTLADKAALDAKRTELGIDYGYVYTHTHYTRNEFNEKVPYKVLIYRLEPGVDVDSVVETLINDPNSADYYQPKFSGAFTDENIESYITTTYGVEVSAMKIATPGIQKDVYHSATAGLLAPDIEVVKTFKGVTSGNPGTLSNVSVFAVDEMEFVVPASFVDTVYKGDIRTWDAVQGFGINSNGRDGQNLYYRGFENVTLNTGDADDQIGIYDFLEPVNVFVNSGAGDDVVTVGNPLTGEDANQQSFDYHTLDGIDANLMIDLGDGGLLGEDKLFFTAENSDTAWTGTLTSTKLTGMGMDVGITYANAELVDITLGAMNDAFNVQNIGTPTNIKGGDGDDLIFVASDAAVVDTDDPFALNLPVSHGDLTGIQAELTIDAQKGKNSLMISDYGRTTPSNGVIASTYIDLAPNRIFYSATGGNFDNHVVIWTGSDVDTLMVDSVNVVDQSVTTIYTGDGDDRITAPVQGINQSDLADLDTRHLHILGMNGRDVIDASGATLAMRATGANDGDVIVGGAGDDILQGDDGDDVLLGGGGNDRIYGESLGSNPSATNDIVVGDFGQATFDANGLLTGIVTTGFTPYDDGNRGAQVYTGSVLTGISTSNQGSDGDDTIIAGDGSDVVLGGGGDDDIDAGSDASRDIVIGDHGDAQFTIVSNRSVLNMITTLLPDQGGADFVRAGDGDDVILGGSGNDFLNVDRFGMNLDDDAGADVILGDNGTATFDTASGSSILRTITTLLDGSTNDQGGDDLIYAADGWDVVFGGIGNDEIDAGIDTGRDIIVGDQGTATFDPDGRLLTIDSVNDHQGGNDVILARDGEDVVIGGFGDDEIDAGADASRDIVLGDGGSAKFRLETLAGDLVSVLYDIRTSGAEFGGSDFIRAGDGDDVVLGGSGVDYLSVDSNGNPMDIDTGNDVMLGDNGYALFDTSTGSSILTMISSADLVDVNGVMVDYGADDFIFASDGSDVVIGGAGNDDIDAGADGSRDIVLGDNGTALFNLETVNGTLISVLQDIRTSSPEVGGSDYVRAGDGDDVVLGGSGVDYLSMDRNGVKLDVDFGADVMLGDNGYAIFDTTTGVSILTTIATQDPTDVNGTWVDYGAGDFIFAADGSDVVMGGSGDDEIDAGTDAGRDIIIGDHGQATFDIEGHLITITTTNPDRGGNDNIIAGD